jgi:hypothetical protein
VAAICVYCSSAEGIDPAFFELATQVGKRLAADGHSLVSGGGRVSMMGAVAGLPGKVEHTPQVSFLPTSSRMRWPTSKRTSWSWSTPCASASG